MRNAAIVLCLLSLLFVAGCASGGGGETKYGAQKRNVTVETSPANGYEIFVVDNEDWVKHEDDLLKGKGLDKYRKGVSPVKLKLYPYKQVFLARDPSGKLTYLVKVPSEDNMTVTIPFTSPATKAQ
jgi:hypothetical protein